ncbi:DMT family transporter [Pseudomonas sp. Fl4BN1]|uniref:DMT family transporter n=1 Tax=Pseudomonas sp. Fl4BN1 TaxID=2697651 RepID=UPI001378F762|nr:DMT family transporter [Pseudomonas sp. Fl4BN1]NBF12362.1 EamA-like transporter family protein [Pseudomonas sp. Fl4BN1]
MTFLLSILLSFLAGFAVPLQAGANSKLGNLLGHPLWATGISLVVSIISLTTIMLFTKAPHPNLTAAYEGPWWIWLGGIAGVLYISISLLMTPRLGALNFIMAVIIGQLTISLLIDYFGLMGLPRKTINVQKTIGLLVVVTGFIITTRS